MKTSIYKKVVCLGAALVCYITINQAHAQSNPDSHPFRRHADSVAAVFGIDRKIPKKFKVSSECKRLNLGDRWVRTSKNSEWIKGGHCLIMGLLLQSSDKKCEVYYDHLCLIVNQYLSDFQDPESFLGFYYELDLTHRNWMMYELLSINKGRDDFRFEDYVTIISGKEAKKRFNADSVFIYDVPIGTIEQDGEVYKYCTRMYVTKKDKPVMSFAWLFTEEGVKKKDYYINKLNKNVRYRD